MEEVNHIAETDNASDNNYVESEDVIIKGNTSNSTEDVGHYDKDSIIENAVEVVMLNANDFENMENGNSSDKGESDDNHDNKTRSSTASESNVVENNMKNYSALVLDDCHSCKELDMLREQNKKLVAALTETMDENSKLEGEAVLLKKQLQIKCDDLNKFKQKSHATEIALNETTSHCRNWRYY